MFQYNVAIQKFEAELQANRLEEAKLLAHQILDFEFPTLNVDRSDRASRALQAALKIPYQNQHQIDLDLVRLFLENGARTEPLYNGDFCPLAGAIIAQNTAAALLVLDFGADPQASFRDAYGNCSQKSVLVWAIEKGLVEVALRLLELGADRQSEPGEQQPLQTAARVGDEVMARALLDRGANPNTHLPDSVIPGKLAGDGYYPSQAPLIEAATTDGNPVLPLLLKRGANVNTSNDNAQNTALHLAAHQNAAVNVRLLLEAGAHPEKVNRLGQTALEMASSSFSDLEPSDSVELLIEAGASMSALDTACKFSIQRGYLECLRLLIEAGAEFKKPQGHSPFVILAEYGKLSRFRFQPESKKKQAMQDDLAVAQLLWDAGARPMPSEVTEALELAAGHGHIELVKWLGAIGGVKSGTNRETPLHVAALRGQRESVEELLAQGELGGLQDSDGFTALMCLAYGGNTGRFWDSPYHFMMHSQPDDWVEENDASIAAMLLNADANLEAHSASHQSAFHLAAKQSAPLVVQLIVDHGADVQARMEHERTALHAMLVSGRANGLRRKDPTLGRSREPERSINARFGSLLDLAEKWDERVLEILLSTALDIHARDYGGWTALHLAAMFATPGAVSQLLRAGADPQARDCQNQRPWDVVFAYGRTQRLFQLQGFTLTDFPFVRADLEVASQTAEVVLPAHLSKKAYPALQRAAQQDSQILRILNS